MVGPRDLGHGEGSFRSVPSCLYTKLTFVSTPQIARSARRARAQPLGGTPPRRAPEDRRDAVRHALPPDRGGRGVGAPRAGGVGGARARREQPRLRPSAPAGVRAHRGRPPRRSGLRAASRRARGARDRELGLNKWSMPVLAALAGDRRFSELRDALPGVSPRALTLALKSLPTRDGRANGARELPAADRLPALRSGTVPDCGPRADRHRRMRLRRRRAAAVRQHERDGCDRDDRRPDAMARTPNAE